MPFVRCTKDKIVRSAFVKFGPGNEVGVVTSFSAELGKKLRKTIKVYVIGKKEKEIEWRKITEIEESVIDEKDVKAEKGLDTAYLNLKLTGKKKQKNAYLVAARAYLKTVFGKTFLNDKNFKAFLKKKNYTIEDIIDRTPLHIDEFFRELLEKEPKPKKQTEDEDVDEDGSPREGVSTGLSYEGDVDFYFENDNEITKETKEKKKQYKKFMKKALQTLFEERKRLVEQFYVSFF